MPSGQLLARLNTEGRPGPSPKALRTGLLDGPRPGRAHHRRVVFSSTSGGGPDGDEPMPPRRWPTPLVKQRVREVERIARDLNLTERDQRLRETRRPDPGFRGGNVRLGRVATTSPTSSKTRR